LRLQCLSQKAFRICITTLEIFPFTKVLSTAGWLLLRFNVFIVLTFLTLATLATLRLPAPPRWGNIKSDAPLGNTSRLLVARFSAAEKALLADVSRCGAPGVLIAAEL
jgi:hypothetical protein